MVKTSWTYSRSLGNKTLPRHLILSKHLFPIFGLMNVGPQAQYHVARAKTIDEQEKELRRRQTEEREKFR